MTPAQVATIEASGLRRLAAAFAAEHAFTANGYGGVAVYGATAAECRLTTRDAVLVSTISTAGTVTSTLVDDRGVLKPASDPTLDPAVAALCERVQTEATRL